MNEFIIKHFGNKLNFIIVTFILTCIISAFVIESIKLIDTIVELYRLINMLKKLLNYKRL